MQTNLDFKLKVIGGDISTIPGISDAIEVLNFDSIVCTAYKKNTLFYLNICRYSSNLHILITRIDLTAHGALMKACYLGM